MRRMALGLKSRSEAGLGRNLSDASTSSSSPTGMLYGSVIFMLTKQLHVTRRHAIAGGPDVPEEVAPGTPVS